MSEKTADDVADFIIKRGGPVNIKWFGGEPLLNTKVLDTISRRIIESGLKLESCMMSNGFLFNENLVRKAKDEWHLEWIQISLDGTEETYNRTKAYVNSEVSPFQRVVRNIGLLLDAGIKVKIRLNQSIENSEDLILLTEELGKIFRGKEKLSIYSHLLFEYDDKLPIEDQDYLIRNYRLILESIRKSELNAEINGGNKLLIKRCMADDDNSLQILPDGKLGKCDVHIDENYVGDIWEGITELDIVRKFKEKKYPEDKCRECIFSPTCKMLKMCPMECNRLLIELRKINFEFQMLAEYERWKKEQQAV